MAYEQIDYEPHAAELDQAPQALVDEAEERFGVFYDKQLNKRYSRYVASEPAQVYAALKWVTEKQISPGERFVEWGSGFGVATGLAATLGYEAFGIELREGLVEIARALHANQAIDAKFLCTSYIPEGFIAYDTGGGEDIVRDTSFGHDAGSSQYADEENEVDLEEVDLFFVYPWPGEQEMMLKLFDAVAGEGAILIAYYGDLDTCIYRKLAHA
jgi:SAM-dependent methyltransferase